ncbi:MAG: GNAT family N-acetyltransferase [Candidatus Zophobacter franzmannii]|nr:GNAT family N-acetyltransferase [Candidatus Zophobacter franzmannii]
MSKYRIENVAMENLTEHSQVICFLNPKHKTYPIKIEWLRKRFEDGLVIKMIHHEDEKKSVGHKKHRNIGVGKMLIDECRKDAKNQGLKGVAVLASGDSFMVDKDLFLKNGFELVATEKPKFSLLVDRFEDAPLPYFNDWKKSLSSIKGLNLIYSDQCP